MIQKLLVVQKCSSCYVPTQPLGGRMIEAIGSLWKQRVFRNNNGKSSGRKNNVGEKTKMSLESSLGLFWARENLKKQLTAEKELDSGLVNKIFFLLNFFFQILLKFCSSFENQDPKMRGKSGAAPSTSFRDPDGNESNPVHLHTLQHLTAPSADQLEQPWSHWAQPLGTESRLRPTGNYWTFVKQEMRDTWANNADELKSSIKETKATSWAPPSNGFRRNPSQACRCMFDPEQGRVVFVRRIFLRWSFTLWSLYLNIVNVWETELRVSISCDRDDTFINDLM